MSLISSLNKVLVGALGVAASAFALNNSLYDVEGGYRAVIFNRYSGVEKTVKDEGTHFAIPFIQYPQLFDIRTRPRSVSTVTGTKDLQQVNLSLRVLSRPSVQHLPAIFKDIGPNYDETVLPSITNEVLKAIVAHYDADQLLTQREKVSREVKEALVARAFDFHIILDDVSITHLTFSKEFSNAIEQKQVAQQDAERSKFIVARVEQEQKARVTLAEGEAEAARLIADSLKLGPGLIEMRKLEAAKEIAQTLAESKNVVYLPGGGGGANAGDSRGPNLLLKVN